MGKIKRRMKYRPCPCGSGRPASECCLKNGKWDKPASKLGLRELPPATCVKRCYMNELNSCLGPISGEHLISESVLRILSKSDEIQVSGLHWIEHDVVKTVTVKNLVSKCLCSKHNSSLSPLDEAAKYFFLSLKNYLTTDTGKPQQALISGHDLERWMLKTTKNLAVSGNFGLERVKLSGTFATDISIVEMLDEPKSWPKGAGLYCIMSSGDRFNYDSASFDIQPHLNQDNEIAAIWFNIMNLKFLLFLVQPDETSFPSLGTATFRPRDIIIRQPKSNNYVTLSWDDGMNHNPIELSKL